MKIHAYKVKTDNDAKLDPLFTYLKTLNEAERIRDTTTTRMRFEDGSKARGSGHWTLDFTKFRDAGPGKAPETSPNVDFDLNDDEYFGEETAALYFPAKNCLVLQYNHHGPRIAAIANYLEIVAGEVRGNGLTEIREIKLQPFAREDAGKRLQNANIIKRLEFTLHVPNAMQATPGKRKAFGSFLKGPVVPSSQTVSVQLSAGHAHTLNVEDVKLFVNQALGLEEGLTTLKVRAGNDSDPIDVIDLLEARLELERTVPPGKKKRQDRSHRWAVLRSAYDEWDGKGLISD